MRIPLPRMPRWLDRALDWLNVDLGPQLWFFQPRRIDILIAALSLTAIVLDGLFFHGWVYAVTVDPLLMILGIMLVAWFF